MEIPSGDDGHFERVVAGYYENRVRCREPTGL
jgi:hypothetical protein